MNSEFDPQALEDLRYWAKVDKRRVEKILRLIEEIKESPFTGKGKPEPLKHQFSGYWARRLDKEHRLIYKVENTRLVILSCRYHYE